MSEIPEDIDRIATDLVRKSYADSECAEWDMYVDIAAALIAERKRCADVAIHLNGWGTDSGKGSPAEHIAKVIMLSP